MPLNILDKQGRTPAERQREIVALRDALKRMWQLGFYAGQRTQMRGFNVDRDLMDSDLAAEMDGLEARGVCGR